MLQMSKKTIAVAAIAAALGFGGAVSYQSLAAPVVPHVPLEFSSHEHMHHAIEALHTAKEALEHADREYHGHRTRAIEATNDAIHHVEEALKD